MDFTKFQFYQGNPQIAAGWIKHLERYGTDIVQLTLRNDTAAPASQVYIGPERMTKGFVQEWLAHQLAERLSDDRALKNKQLFWTKAATIAAAAAAAAAVMNAVVALFKGAAGG